MQIFTPRLILREFRESDFPDFRAWDGDVEIQRYELGRPAGEAESRYFFEQILQTNLENPRSHWRFAVTLRPGDRAVGRISLTVNNPSNREFEIGWTVNRQLWGQGIATEAARAVMEMAFRQLDAHRLIAFCHADNHSSARVMQKLGMQPEGHFREALWLYGRWWDELLYAILDREFKQ